MKKLDKIRIDFQYFNLKSQYECVIGDNRLSRYIDSYNFQDATY
jgi:hypothetical protein